MEQDNKIIMECGDDAAKWARAFAAALAENPAIATDEATMLGWFANAIESRPRAPRLTASEAVFGFAGWLTSRGQPVTMSSKHNAATVADLVSKFCEVNDLTPPRPEWNRNLTHPAETR